MLGPAKPRRLDEPITVSLEDLAPQSHSYRHGDLGHLNPHQTSRRAQYHSPALVSMS